MADSAADHLITAHEIYKTYTTGTVSVHALRGVTMSVAHGEMVAIMGPSGCGKTTLLNCISGLDNVDAGVIKIGGIDLAEMSDDEKTRYRATKMGYIFQSYNLLPVLTAIENVELPLLVSGTKSSDARKKARVSLDMVGLSHRERHYPTELSGGEQQRVTIARALVNQPAIVWGDEPTGNLDSGNAEEIMNLLCKLNVENGQSFVLATHSEGVAARTHYTIRMRDGQITDINRHASSSNSSDT